MCAACGQPGHRFGFNEGPDRFDPTACINGLLYDLDAARRAHRVAVRALSQALGERDRLTDGIRFLVNTYDPYEAPDASMPVRELRLLDVAGDDTGARWLYRHRDGTEAYVEKLPGGQWQHEWIEDGEVQVHDTPPPPEWVRIRRVAGDDALDEIVRVSEEAGLYDDPVPYRALEGSEGGEDG